MKLELCSFIFALWSTFTVTCSFTLPSPSSESTSSSRVSRRSCTSTSLHLIPQAGAQLAAASAAIYAKLEEEKKKEQRTVNVVSTTTTTTKVSPQDVVVRSSTDEMQHGNSEGLGGPIESIVGSVVTPTQAARVFLSRVFSLTSNHDDLVDSIPHTTNNDQLESSLQGRSTSSTSTPNRLGSTDEQQQQQQHHVDFSMFLPSFHHKDTEEDIVRYPITGFTLVTTTDDADPQQFQVHALPPPNVGSACDIVAMKESKASPVYGWFSSACRLGNLFDDDKSYVNPSEMDDLE